MPRGMEVQVFLAAVVCNSLSSKELESGTNKKIIICFDELGYTVLLSCFYYLHGARDFTPGVYPCPKSPVVSAYISARIPKNISFLFTQLAACLLRFAVKRIIRSGAILLTA